MASTTSNSFPSRFQRTESLETYRFFWINTGERAETDEKQLKTQGQLCQIMHQMKVFDSVKHAEEDVNSGSSMSQKAVVVLCGSITEEMIGKIHQWKQVTAIYIYGVENKYENQYTKVKGIYSDGEEMIKHFNKDQYLRERTDDDSNPMGIYSRTKANALEERNAMFMHLQLFLEIIFQMAPTPEKAKTELLLFLKDYYRENPIQRDIIDEFERHYLPERAIWWYTRDTCLYRLLNRALREHDFTVLVAFRFFMIDLHKQLQIEHRKYLATLEQSVLHIYRGQAINEDELILIRENIGEFISINSFLSATTKRETAVFFAESSTTGFEPNKLRILFEFEIVLDNADSLPFAYIRDLSYFAEEDEVLISLGKIFRVKRVEFNDEQNLWIAKFELCSENNFELIEILQHEKKRLGPTPSLVSLGLLFRDIGEYEKAKNVLEEVLAESREDREKRNCYLLLGDVARFQDQHDAALENYFNCVEVQERMNMLNEHHGETYCYIAEVYIRKKEFDLALEFAQKALSFIPDDHRYRGDVYREIGDIYREKKQYNLALDYFQKVLEIQQRTLPKDNKEFGVTYEHLANTYECMENYPMALEAYSESFRIDKKTLPPTHEYILSDERNIKRMKEKMNIE